MPHRCPACQTVIDDALLIACPRCHTPLSTPAQAPTLTQAQEDRLTDRLTRPVALAILKRWWFWAGSLGLLLALFGVSYPTIRAKVEEMVTSQIAQRFAQPRTRDTFQEVAENQASNMLRDEIQPAVDRFRADLQKEYQAVSEEVSRLRIQNKLPILGDKAISQADRQSLEEIYHIVQTAPEHSSLKKVAIEQLERVECQYGFGGRTHLIMEIITTRPEDSTVWDEEFTVMKISKNITTDKIIMRLSDPEWRVRAKSAMLLGGRKEKGVPDILLKVIREDKHLDVVRWAIISFHNITKVRIRAIDPFGADNPWDVRGMFDFHGLEQWWQAHSAEVNERLADIK